MHIASIGRRYVAYHRSYRTAPVPMGNGYKRTNLILNHSLQEGDCRTMLNSSKVDALEQGNRAFASHYERLFRRFHVIRLAVLSMLRCAACPSMRRCAASPVVYASRAIPQWCAPHATLQQLVSHPRIRPPHNQCTQHIIKA